MSYTLNADSKEPLFRQLARQIEQQIRTGQLTAHSLLPTERTLAAQLGMNRSTVSAAYQELANAGLVHKLQGSGTRVIGIEDHDPDALSINWEQYWNKRADNPLLAYKKQLHQLAAHPDTINLAMGELSRELMERIILPQLLAEPDHFAALGYTGQVHDHHYRTFMADYLQHSHGIAATPEQILTTSGAQQALYLIVNSLLKPGDAIAIEMPSYAYAQNLFISAGLRVFPIRLDQDGLIPEQIIGLYNRYKIKMVVVNPTFQNPTGTVLTLQRRRQLYELCAARRIPIVEDDPYSLLHSHVGEAPPLSLKALYPKSELILYIGTASKMLSPALRTGWLVAAPPVIRKLADYRREIDNGSSMILQDFTRLLLEQATLSPHLHDLRVALAKRRDHMLHLLHAHLAPYVSWLTPQGGFYVWCTCNESVAFSDFLRYCGQAGVLIMPGHMMERERRSFRLTYSRIDEGLMEEGVLRVADALRKATLLS